MRRLTTVAVAVLALALTACSGGDDEADEGGSTAPDAGESSSEAAEEEPLAPECADVWQEGQTLPADYEGCMEGETLLVATSFDCRDGRSLYTYEGVEPNLFAFDQEPIQVGGAADQAYADAYSTCQ